MAKKSKSEDNANPDAAGYDAAFAPLPAHEVPREDDSIRIRVKDHIFLVTKRWHDGDTVTGDMVTFMNNMWGEALRSTFYGRLEKLEDVGASQALIDATFYNHENNYVWAPRPERQVLSPHDKMVYTLAKEALVRKLASKGQTLRGADAEVVDAKVQAIIEANRGRLDEQARIRLAQAAEVQIGDTGDFASTKSSKDDSAEAAPTA